MTQSFVFYKSFWEALRGTWDNEKPYTSGGANAALWALELICNYAFDGIEPDYERVADTNPLVHAIFVMAKPQIDANNERRENGKKGGRKKDNSADDSDNIE